MRGITYFRKRLGLTTDELGNLIGIKRYSISKWDAGKQTIPKKHLKKIENIFKEEISQALISEDIFVDIEWNEQFRCERVFP